MRQWNRRIIYCTWRVATSYFYHEAHIFLREGAKDLLDEYYHLQGGRPEPPAPKKRKSIGDAKATPQKTEQKRRRKSRASEEPKPADSKDQDVPDWVPKTKSWENEVVTVDTILREPETGMLFAYLHWKNGKKSKVSIETCYEKCPLKVSVLVIVFMLGD